MVASSIEIFLSYAHEDESFLKELSKHLKLMERQGLIKAWHDQDITSGSEWKSEIDTHLDSAQIILLLVSADFLASDYCYCTEMKRALERHALDEATVIPVILRSVDWHSSPIGKLQALPKDAKPISTWSNTDAAYTDIVKGIRRVIESKIGVPSDSDLDKGCEIGDKDNLNASQYQENRGNSTGLQLNVSGGTVNINAGPTSH